MNRRTKAIIVGYRRELAATCAALGVLIMLNLLIPWRTHPIVIAARTIPMGSIVSRQDLTTINSRYTWATAFSSTSLLIGKSTSRTISQGEPLLKSSLVAATLLDGLPAGQVAVAVPVSPIDAGLIHVGDSVSILSANSANEGITVAARAHVLTITKDSHSSLLAQSSAMTVVVVVNAADARAIAGVRESQPFTLVLLRASQ